MGVVGVAAAVFVTSGGGRKALILFRGFRCRCLQVGIIPLQPQMKTGIEIKVLGGAEEELVMVWADQHQLLRERKGDILLNNQ